MRLEQKSSEGWCFLFLVGEIFGENLNPWPGKRGSVIHLECRGREKELRSFDYFFASKRGSLEHWSLVLSAQIIFSSPFQPSCGLGELDRSPTHITLVWDPLAQLGQTSLYLNQQTLLLLPDSLFLPWSLYGFLLQPITENIFFPFAGRNTQFPPVLKDQS